VSVFTVVSKDCGCWWLKDTDGHIHCGRSCKECLILALDKMERFSYLDKVVSVSGSVEGEDSHG